MWRILWALLCLPPAASWAAYVEPITCQQLPALTGDATKPAGSCAATLAAGSASNLNSGNLPQARAPTGGTNLQFWQTNGSGTGAWASTPAAICGGSGSVSNGAGATDFIGIANLSTTEATVQFPAPFAGTAAALYASSSVAPGGSKSFTYTVDKAASAQAVTCATSGASATACNDTAHSFTFAAGDLLSVKLVTSVSSGTGAHSFCLKVTTP